MEPPRRYPPLARQARVAGTVALRLRIDPDGTVLLAAPLPEYRKGGGTTIFEPDAQMIVQTWRFACVGCLPNSPFDQIVRLNYKLDFQETALPLRVVMDLPGEITITGDGNVPIDTNTTRKSSGKESY
jgi:hypothetical protein